MDKSSDAFRTISEVAGDLDLPQHVLRFWETRFAQIKPLKRGGGRRYYRPDDVDLLKGIRHLLYGEGYTIKGVQRILKEQGVRFVMTLWQEGAPGLDSGAYPRDHDSLPDADDEIAIAHVPDDDDGASDMFGPYEGEEEQVIGDFGAIPRPAVALSGTVAARSRNAESSHSDGERGHFPPDRAREATPGPTRTVTLMPSPQVAKPATGRVQPEEPVPPEAIAHRFAPRLPDGGRPADMGASGASARLRGETRGRELPGNSAAPARQQVLAPMLDKFRGVANRMSPDLQPRGPGAASGEHATGQGLSREDVRRLQATLFELLECKRLLDQTR